MGAEAASYGSRGDVVLGAGAEACLLRKDVTNPADKSEYSQGVAIGSRAKVYGTQSTSIGADSRSIGHSSIAIGGDDIDKAKPVLTAAIPDMATTGVQKNFNRELAVLYPGTTLGSAAINDSKNYVNTASIGNASMAIGMMTQSYGTGSTAIGVNTLTKGIASTGIGVMARSWGDKSLALGSRAETYGNKSTAVGDANTVGFDMTDGTTSGAASSAVGTDNKVYGNNSYAIGGGNTIGSATITETTEANGDKIKKVTAGTVKGSTAGAFGYKNTVTTDNAYVVGNNSTASADGAMVLGSSASVTGKNGVALGNNTKVANENAIALGAGSETAAAVATPSATINGTAHNFAGVNPASTVSVGKAGSERTITNVAAGRISAASTDAINGSQLYAVTSEIDKGVAYAGDVKAAAAAANKFTRKLGEQTNIVGGVADTSKLTDGNIGVVSNGTDTLNIKLAKNVKVDSVTTGNTVINNNGLTVGGKTYVTNNGLNANNQKVTNVADGQVAAGSKDAVNGGQLHDAKNEVINKGLRFDADNNSEKTNKLGSKVTVNGDNNITTEITQTGDDTKIGVKLNKDIHVKTVTATDTVKAGSVTMGGQTVANAAGANESGNYVTGLDNKTWNIQNPNIVSGRGATEDQLKIVSDEVKKQGANATDYRLVQNASSADGSYTVDTNGNIDLTVQDKNHTDKTETVKLKDIASKSKLDDVIAKGLQFDANAGGTKTNKLGSKITVKGEGTAADTEYSGENLKTFITQDPAGNTTIDVKMNKNLKVETIVATGENGKDGKIGINGKDGVTTNISVTRDGKPGVDGAPGTTTTRIVYEKPDGTKEEVATLNDGMKYGGDIGNVIKKKLNEQVNVVGGITDENKLTTEDNLGVVSDGSNNLKVRLAKALKGLESVTTGDTVMNNNGVTINNGAAGNTVSLTKNGLDNGGNKITNVADGVDGTDAVNVSQLKKAVAGATTKVADGKNTTVTSENNPDGSKTYHVNLNDKVTLGTDPTKQVTIDGTTGIIKAGDKVTIDGTTGNIDAGKVKINGKDGTVNGLTNKTWDPNNFTSGQAATEDQLKAVDQKITNTSEELTKKGMDFAGNDGEFHRNLGDKVTIKGEGTKAASEYSGENIKTFADANGNLTVKMDKNLKTETIVATGKNGKDGKIGINGKDGVTTNISVTRDGKPGVDGAPGTTTTRIVYEKPDGTKEEVATLNDGMKYGGDTGNVIKKKLNEQVNVVGGITDENKLTTEDNLGVVSDGSNNLKVRLAKALKGLESVTTGDTVMNNNGVTINNGAAGNTVSLTKNGLDNGGNKITNVADGVDGTDAVNVSQLKKAVAGATTKVADGKNTTVTSENNPDGSKTYHVNLNDKVTLGTDPTKQVTIDGTTGIIKAGDKVTIDGTTGNIDAGKVKINGKDGTVNGLTNKTWDPNNFTSGQAATEDQLKAVDQKITNTSEELTKKGMDFAGNDGEFHRNLGDKVTIKGEGTKAASEYSGENIKTFADANGNLTVKMDKNLKTETIVATGKNGKDGKIGINGKDGVTTNISVTRDGKPGVDGAPGTTTTRIVYEKPDGTKEEVATLNDGMKYGGDTGNVIKKKLNEQVNVVGGITDTNKLTTEDNLGVVSDGNNNLKVRMAKDLKGLNSVTTNTLTVGDVKIDNSGINAGNKKITNVAAGDISANSTDAVNGGQLWKTNQTINNIGGAVNELGDRMDRVGAGAAALAALHPLDFDPDDKWDVAAGYGNYKDAHAVAVGAFYRPNEDTMFSVGGSFGGGENMVNAGVSVKLGQGNHVSTSRVALAKEVEDLKAIVKAQSAEIKAMRGAMQSGASVMKDVNFPDVPKDHWAYSYVKSLADRGLLEGYPDGEFKGDRSMTRYEFAAIIYRALQNGAPIDSDMAKAIGEFDPEINRIKDLDRIRVDRISGKDNDRHKVERVRVNNESNKEKGDYRDVYGSHISPEA